MQRLRLITIPLSHFCEKARWALDLAGLDYVEEGSLPLFHMLATRRHGGRSTPLLVTPEGALRDSTDILMWVDRRHRLYPEDAAQRAEVVALEDQLDEVLGPHLRRVGYFHALPDRERALAVVTQGVAAWQARLARPLFPVLKRLLVASLKLTPTGAGRSTEKVRAIFAEVSTRLADGRRYLIGDTFTAADLTLAALAAPLLYPPGHPIRWPDEGERPPAIRALSEELRGTPAGAFALRMYAEHRPARGGLG
ncbi:MAG: glutathione S-transferase N-terminal domain-containing protein [Deltaproteobacteria bacterium]|nr:glutathione S-transferase N-terminal domain-containing protein [Deltaproteobacteria bacterium]